MILFLPPSFPFCESPLARTPDLLLSEACLMRYYLEMDGLWWGLMERVREWGDWQETPGGQIFTSEGTQTQNSFFVGRPQTMCHRPSEGFFPGEGRKYSNEF